MSDDQTIERFTAHLGELRSLVARARRSGLTRPERERFAELRTRLAEMYVELAFLGAGSDAEALRIILTPPAGTA